MPLDFLQNRLLYFQSVQCGELRCQLCAGHLIFLRTPVFLPAKFLSSLPDCEAAACWKSFSFRFFRCGRIPMGGSRSPVPSAPRSAYRLPTGRQIDLAFSLALRGFRQPIFLFSGVLFSGASNARGRARLAIWSAQELTADATASADEAFVCPPCHRKSPYCLALFCPRCFSTLSTASRNSFRRIRVQAFPSRNSSTSSSSQLVSR